MNAPFLVLGLVLSAGNPPPAPVVIERVNVVDTVAGRVVPDRTVVVRGDAITAVAAADGFARPAGAVVVDGRGKYLIPGLWDMHAHLADPRMKPLFVASGVTGVRHMFSVNPLYPVRAARAAHPDGGPRVVGTDTLIDGPGTPFPRLVRQNVWTVTTADEARKAVRKTKDAGEDFVKIYSNLSPEAFAAVIDEAGKQKLPVVGHVPARVPVASAAAAGLRCVEHLTNVAVGCAADPKRFEDELAAGLAAGKIGRAGDVTGWRLQVRAHADYDAPRAAGLFKVFADRGTWHCPTLVQTRAWATLADPAVRHDPRLAFLPDTVRGYWAVDATPDGVRLPGLGVALTRDDLWLRTQLLAAEVRLVGEMHRAGVPLLAGTDTPNPYCLPGFALHDELDLFVRAGLTPAEALRTATVNPGKFLGRADVGTVAVGSVGDLVLLDANPLDDIRNARYAAAVVVAGTVLTRDALLRSLAPDAVARR